MVVRDTKKNLKSQSLFAFSTVTVMRPESSDLDLNLTSQQSLGEKLGMNQVLSRIFCDFIQISIFFLSIDKLPGLR